MQHLAHVGDDVAQVEILGLHHVLRLNMSNCRLAARSEAKNTAGGIRGLRRHLPGGPSACRCDLDDGEHVVEIMRHAGGELADGFHLCDWRNWLSRLSRFGDVASTQQ